MSRFLPLIYLHLINHTIGLLAPIQLPALRRDAHQTWYMLYDVIYTQRIYAGVKVNYIHNKRVRGMSSSTRPALRSNDHSDRARVD